jgi:hypothetical protein
MFPDPLVRISGSTDVDVSPRRLGGKLMIHLVNTAGPHADAPEGGITAVPPVGPLSVSVRLARAPKSVTCQPEGAPLEVSWTTGRAAVELPRLELYSVLVVEQ